MTLSNLIGINLEKISVNPDMIKRLLAAAERNLSDSKIKTISLVGWAVRPNKMDKKTCDTGEPSFQTQAIFLR